MTIIRRLLRCNLLLLLLTVALSLPVLPDDAPSRLPPAGAEHHISKEEAQELFRSVDEILQFASDQTGLPIVHPVKKKLATRDEVAKYVAKRLKEQESDERLNREALPLKKLGLLPRDFDLRKYMVDLYKEQVEGWYDTHNKTVYLLDWVSPEVQKPVMAHELVHALQDQNFGLDEWLNISKDSKEPSVQISLEEKRVARQSVIEGQAMAVLMEYEHKFKKSGQPPSGEGTNGSAAGSQEDDTPVFSNSPVYLREALLFPYTYGLDFVRVVLAERGKQAAFAGVLQHPPVDTRQVMQPSTYLSSEPQPEINVVAIDRVLGPEWQRVDVSGLGEIDLRILMRVWGGEPAAKLLTAGWDGGYYVALSRKKAPKDAPLSLALTLKFKSENDALVFASSYISGLGKRYSSVQPATTGAPVVQPAAASDAAYSHRLLGQWITEEGLVSLYVDGDRIVALESFAPADAAKVHAALVPLAATTIH